jgi:hypothetical protein
MRLDDNQINEQGVSKTESVRNFEQLFMRFKKGRFCDMQFINSRDDWAETSYTQVKAGVFEGTFEVVGSQRANTLKLYLFINKHSLACM